jgi:hypothetical protein
MTRRDLTVSVLAAGLLLLTGCAGRATVPGAMAPPGGPYQKVSVLFPPFPEYLHGLGTLYVDASTLPAGPFLAYDQERRLVATMFMIPIRDLETHKNLADLGVAPGMNPLRVQLYYNEGHPGVAEPHYHVVLWYVPVEQEPK